MRRNINRPLPSARVMRQGKTKRDHASGAWANHRKNKDWRRLEGLQKPAEREL
jgi:hypothetical protein